MKEPPPALSVTTATNLELTAQKWLSWTFLVMGIPSKQCSLLATFPYTFRNLELRQVGRHDICGRNKQIYTGLTEHRDRFTLAYLSQMQPTIICSQQLCLHLIVKQRVLLKCCKKIKELVHRSWPRFSQSTRLRKALINLVMGILWEYPENTLAADADFFLSFCFSPSKRNQLFSVH